MIDIDRRNTRGWPKTRQQYDLCQAMVVEGLSQSDAGRQVGYATKTIDKKLSSIVKELAPYIAHLRVAKTEVIARNWEVTVDRVIDELAQIGFVNPKAYIRVVHYRGVPMVIGKPLNDLTDDQAKAIVRWDRHQVITDAGIEYDYRYQFYDKRQSLRDMGQHIGMYNDRLILEQRITKIHKVDLSQVPDEILEKWMGELKKHSESPSGPAGPATIDNDTGVVG